MGEIVTICLLVLSLVFQSSLSPYSFRLWLWLKVEFPEWAAGWLFILLGKVLEIAMLMKSRFRPGFACFLGRGEPCNLNAEICIYVQLPGCVGSAWYPPLDWYFCSLKRALCFLGLKKNLIFFSRIFCDLCKPKKRMPNCPLYCPTLPKHYLRKGEFLHGICNQSITLGKESFYMEFVTKALP